LLLNINGEAPIFRFGEMSAPAGSIAAMLTLKAPSSNVLFCNHRSYAAAML
jgi:hypothetical protein